MKLMRKLAGNSAYLFLDWVAVTVLALIFNVIIWKTLPPEDVGIYSIAVNMIVLVSTFGVFGMHATVNKLIPEYISRKRPGQAGSLIRFSTKLLVAINIPLSIIFFAFATYSGFDLKLPPPAVIGVCVGIVIWPLAHLTTDALKGLQNMRRVYTTDMWGGIAKVASGAALIFMGFSFVGPIAAVTLSFLVSIIMRIDIFSFARGLGSEINRGFIIKKYALPTLVASVSWAMFINTPTIILALADSLKSSGLFYTAMSMTNPLGFLPTIIGQALFPITAALMASRNHVKKQAELFSMTLRYTLLISIPLLMAYVFMSKAFVLVLARVEYLDAVSLIPIMGPAILIQAIGQIFLSSLFAIGKTEANRNIYILTAATFLATAIPATFLAGMAGLIWAFVLAVAVFMLSSYLVLKRNMDFRLPWSDFAKTAAASCVMGMFLAIPYVLGFKIVAMVPFLAVGALAYVWSLGVLGFYRKVDVDMARMVESRAGALGKHIRPLREFVERNARKI